MNEPIEARALRLEIDRTTKRLRSNLNQMRAELDRVDSSITDHTATSRGRRVVSVAAEIAQHAARLDTLHGYGNLVGDSE